MNTRYLKDAAESFINFARTPILGEHVPLAVHNNNRLNSSFPQSIK